MSQPTPIPGGKSRNPVRRSNSSPEMSSNWKNPFLKDKGRTDDEPSKARVSCEAIPEEMTPPDPPGPIRSDSLPQKSTSGSNHPGFGPHTFAARESLGSTHSLRLSGPGPSSPTSNPPTLVQGSTSNLTTPISPRILANPSPLGSTSPRSSGPTPADLPPRHDPSHLKLDMSLSVDVHVKNVKGPATVGLIESHTDSHTALPSGTFTRDRSRTISVMSPVRKSRYELELTKSKMHSPRNKETAKSGVSPSFVFLQLYRSDHFGTTEEKPLLISDNPVFTRAISNLDRIMPYETHTIGVVYVGPEQVGNEADMLSNEFGSIRYATFLQRLGTLINLKDADKKTTFLAGLDQSGPDGRLAYIWQDDITQVALHVATLLPNKESDPNCNDKRRHIGNDFVTIFYNESGEELPFMKLGQFTYVNIVIEPIDFGSHKVIVRTGEELKEFGHRDVKIVSDENLPILARQLAIHSSLASQVWNRRTNNQEPWASNWLERLRSIKRLRKKVLEFGDSSEQDQKLHKDPVDDFTEYTCEDFSKGSHLRPVLR